MKRHIMSSSITIISTFAAIFVGTGCTRDASDESMLLPTHDRKLDDVDDDGGDSSGDGYVDTDGPGLDTETLPPDTEGFLLEPCAPPDGLACGEGEICYSDEELDYDCAWIGCCADPCWVGQESCPGDLRCEPLALPWQGMPDGYCQY